MFKFRSIQAPSAVLVLFAALSAFSVSGFGQTATVTAGTDCTNTGPGGAACGFINSTLGYAGHISFNSTATFPGGVTYTLLWNLDGTPPTPYTFSYSFKLPEPAGNYWVQTETGFNEIPSVNGFISYSYSWMTGPISGLISQAKNCWSSL